MKEHPEHRAEAKQDLQLLNAQKNVFMFDNIHEMDNGQEMYSIDGNQSEWSLMSLMARLNYSYADRYLITATVRRDGSSRFGSNNRWGTFPSISLAWRPSKEAFFPENKVVNDLKIRAGYGVTGSQASVGNYGYLATYDLAVYSFGAAGKEQSTLFARTLANPSLHWEEVAQTNVGVDIAFLDSRIQFSIDGYLKDTRDMLVKASIPITSGFEDTSTTFTNAGKVRNSGIEMSLHSVNFAGEFNWETDINATWNRNKIVDLNSDVPNYINQINNSYVTMLANGYPINVFYGYVTDGIFQNQTEIDKHAYQPGAEPGDIRFRDLNNDGVINDSDRTVIGNPNPSWLFSMNNRFEWKGLELNIYLQGVAGNQIFNANNVHCLVPAYVKTTIHLADLHRPERFAINDDPYYTSEEYKAGQLRGTRGVMSGIPDWYVGECVFTAIEDEKFYIFTHPESQVAAQPRVQRLASGINPKT